MSITWSLGTWEAERGSCCLGWGGYRPPSPPRDPRAAGQGAQHCHHQVDDAKILLQPVAHELDPHVDEETQLQVGGFEGGEVLGGDLGVQVSRLDPRVLGQVIHHLRDRGRCEGSVSSLCVPQGWAGLPYLLLGGDVVVDEGDALVGALPAHTRDPGHRHLAGLDSGFGPVTAQLGLLLRHRTQERGDRRLRGDRAVPVSLCPHPGEP